MSINNVGGPVSGAAFGQGSSLPKSAQTATLLTPASMRELANAGWISGKVLAGLENGAYRIATNIGEITISAPQASLKVGSGLMLSYEQTSGRVVYTPAFPGGGSEVPKDSEGAQKPSPVPPAHQVSSVSAPLSLTLGEMPPIQRAISAGSSHANQTLSVIFPTSTNGSFALIAALFPMVVRGGVLSKLATEQDRRYASSSRLHKLAEEALAPVKKIDDSVGFMNWSLPFFSEGQAHMAKWFQGEESVSGDDDRKVSRTFLEVWFSFCGTAQVDAVLDGKSLSIQIVTEKVVSEELRQDISDIVKLLGKTFEFNTEFHYVAGAEFLEHHFEDKKLP